MPSGKAGSPTLTRCMCRLVILSLTLDLIVVQYTDTRRIGRINHDENTPDCPLHVIEVDASTSNVDPETSKGAVWSEGSPRVDGVIICYDASDEVSFWPVEKLLRQLLCF